MQLSFAAEQHERLAANDENIIQTQLSLEAGQMWEESIVLNLGATNLFTRFIETLHERFEYKNCLKVPEFRIQPSGTYKTAAAIIKYLKPEKNTCATLGLPIKYLGIIVKQYSKVSKFLHKKFLKLALDKQIS